MNTQTQKTKKQIQIDQLTEFANELKKNGFTVLVSAKYPFEWLHYEKNGRFGTVSPDHFFNFNFGTVHKPCREAGTGFGTDREAELTIKNAENSLSRPKEFSNYANIKYYSGIEDFINSTNNKWAEYYIL